MSVRTLAVKYRPSTWDEVVEQGSVKTILQQQLATGTTKNAYLFCGGAGTGKTTCARIFANELNKHQGNSIEIDAASHSSVEDVREIIQQAKSKSLDSEYKVFIVDECFPANTLVDTNVGKKPIKDIKPSDIVVCMSGYSNVTHIFTNRVLTNRLCCVILHDRKIVTTVDHLFFTKHGWVCARDLHKGDVVYANNVFKDLSSMRQRIQCAEQSQGNEILLQLLRNKFSLCTSERGAAAESCERDASVPNMQYTVYCEGNQFETDLLLGMSKQINYSVEYSAYEYRIWDEITETVIRKNVEKQSNVSDQCNRQNDADQREERDTTSWLGRESGWQREIYNTTDNLMASLGQWMEIGVFDRITHDRLPDIRVSYELQSRPWFSDEEAGSRGRWSRASVEKQFIKRPEKDRLFTEVGVESVEIYKRGNNDELFLSSLSDTELSGEYVTMYDLEVSGEHCYTANGILVHNCHSISNTGWQAFLKLIEEPPAKSIFIFCTTDPQKIPKTILSRVQRYDFQRITHKGVGDRLVEILRKEDIQCFDAEAIDYLCKISDGGMRDAITLMDKCLAYNPSLTIENVIKALGTVDYDIMVDLASNIIIGKDVADIIKIIEEVHRAGKDLKQFMKSFTNFVLDLTKYACLKSFEYLETPCIYEDDVSYISVEDEKCRHLLSTLIKLNTDIKWETSPKSVIIATLILECEVAE